MVIDVLKWDGQCPRSIQVLAISIDLIIHLSFLMIFLMWLQDNLSGPGADELLYFSMASISSFLENSNHVLMFLLGILFNSWISISWDYVELKELWRVSHRLSNLIHGWPLYLMALIAGSLCFLTQFMSFHGLYFLLVISLILLLKKVCLVFLTVLLNFFQSSRHLDWWYVLRSLW